MLGVVTNPTTTPSDVEMQRLAEQFGKGDTFHAHPGRRVLRPRRQAGARPDRPRPVLRRRRPGAHRLHPVRRVHDRLPARRQEHPHDELPLPRREERRRDPPADHGHRRASPQARAATRSAPCAPGAGSPGRPHLHRRPGRLLGRHLQHAEAAAPPARDEPAPHLTRGSATSPAPTPRLCSACAMTKPPARLHRGRRDHLVLAPGREHPHRAVPLRQGQQRHGPAEHASSPTAARRRHRWAQFLARDAAPPGRAAPARAAQVVRAGRSSCW